jgi:phage-related protein
MANNTVTWTIAGDSSSLERAMNNAGSSAKKMAGDLDKAEGKAKSFGGAIDGAAGAADASESKFMGAADLLDGLGGAFGLPTEGATGMMRAFGDLSGGFSVIAPLVGQVKTAFMALSSVMFTPPMGIILLVAGLAAALVVAYQKSETFRDIVKGAFEVVKNSAIAVWDFIKTIPEKLMGLGASIRDAILWPYKTAFNLVSDAWNATIGKVGFKAPDWVPLVGGKGWNFPNMPRFHSGGTVPGPRGAEVPILAMAGETVSPAGAGGGTTIIQLVLDGQVVTEVVHSGLLRKQRRTPLGLAT